jgi:hypothetical protein
MFSTLSFLRILPSNDVGLQGIFQGRLVARTFLEHLHIINIIDKKHRVQEPPVGALVLAVQAVCHLVIIFVLAIH